MIFETETGSTYEIDHARNRVRRLRGTTPGTPRIGTDGAWRNYREITDVRVGFSVLIYWGGEFPDSTVTSHVVAVLA